MIRDPARAPLRGSSQLQCKLMD